MIYFKSSALHSISHSLLLSSHLKRSVLYESLLRFSLAWVCLIMNLCIYIAIPPYASLIGLKRKIRFQRRLIERWENWILSNISWSSSIYYFSAVKLRIWFLWSIDYSLLTLLSYYYLFHLHHRYFHSYYYCCFSIISSHSALTLFIWWIF